MSNGRYQAYPAYKDSDIEWLGSIPAHWSVEPFKRQVERNDGGVWGDDPDGKNDTIVLRSTEQTVDGHWQLDDPAPRKLTKAEVEGALLLEGDLLLTKSSGSSLHIGKTTLVTPEVAALRCCYSNFMQRIRTTATFSPKLAWYVLNNELARRQLDLLSNSTTGLANLNATMVGQILVICPPLPEQTQIAKFLDHETARIDRLIEKQEELIRLLKEKRQAVISHAVTKGLNPHAPLKDSGIEWLGQVPAHWVVTTLKYLVAVPIIDGPHESPVRCDEGIPFVSAEALSGGTVDFEKKWGYISPKDHRRFSQRFSPQRGDIFMVKLGATTGAVGIVETDEIFNIWVPLAAIRPIPSIESRFIFHFLKSESAQDAVRLSWTYGTQQTLGLKTLSNFRIPVPPKEERVRIIDYIDSKIPIFDNSIEKATASIALMQERRTALISAAVTGKIDVRHWQPREN